MPKIGYHASHEQFAPRDLLEWVQAAEQAGFALAMCSDHFHPWSERRGGPGFAWSWLGAALQATSLPFGVVTTPGYRYHPAVLAQAAATLTEMYPGRFWVALGSGEALNEHVVGGEWPAKHERNARLEECAEVMRSLWEGETVTRRGDVDVKQARLYTRSAWPPPIIGPALTPATAEWLGGWADGLITVNKPDQEHRQVIEAFRRGGGEGKPVYLQVHLSWAENEEEALQIAYEEWRTVIFPSTVLSQLRTPAEFDAAATFVAPEDLRGHVRTSADLERHVEWLREDVDLGVSAIYLHNVGPNQRAFIDAFGAHVLPSLTNV